MKHRKNKVFAGLLALLFAAGISLTACNKENGQLDNTTPPSQTNGANTNEPSETPLMLTEKDAQTLVEEKLPEGYTIEPVGFINEQGASVSVTDVEEGKHYYFAWDVYDSNHARAGGIAVDSMSGERYNYNGGQGDTVITAYSDFPLYNAATDAIEDWNGVFKNGNISVELLQGDPSSFEFEFSDNTAGVARIQGNTASYNDGELTFTYQEDGSLEIKGKFAELTGTYTPAKSSAP